VELTHTVTCDASAFFVSALPFPDEDAADEAEEEAREGSEKGEEDEGDPEEE
jgi:hypothetical protein